MDNVLEFIRQVAKKYDTKNVFLFGSRARGDNNEKSDYDIAFVSHSLTQEEKIQIKESISEFDTLHKIDLIFLKNLCGSDELTKNILKDGISLMSKFDIKLDNFKKAAISLEVGISEFESTGILTARDGVIQRFEFTTELAWKTTREYLTDQGLVEINTPKMVMKEAFSADIITDEQGWLQILNDRNSTPHIYDEKEASEIFDRIKNNHIALFNDLIQKLS